LRRRPRPKLGCEAKERKGKGREGKGRRGKERKNEWMNEWMNEWIKHSDTASTFICKVWRMLTILRKVELGTSRKNLWSELRSILMIHNNGQEFHITGTLKEICEVPSNSIQISILMIYQLFLELVKCKNYVDRINKDFLQGPSASSCLCLRVWLNASYRYHDAVHWWRWK